MGAWDVFSQLFGGGSSGSGEKGWHHSDSGSGSTTPDPTPNPDGTAGSGNVDPSGGGQSAGGGDNPGGGDEGPAVDITPYQAVRPMGIPRQGQADCSAALTINITWEADTAGMFLVRREPCRDPGVLPESR
jgi:hypothetical protein